MKTSPGTAAKWIDPAEKPMLVVATVAVAIYMGDLDGLWLRLGVQQAYETVSIAIDILFVVDLVIKLALLRGSYLKSPWFLIDLLSSLPAINAFQMFPGAEALRWVRTFRFFRVLRTLRVLRVLRSLRLLKLAKTIDPGQSGDSRGPEERQFEIALFVSVIAYSLFFVATLVTSHQASPPGQIVGIEGAGVADEIRVIVEAEDGERSVHTVPADKAFYQSTDAEYYLVLGSVMGMVFVLVVMRFQIPAISVDNVRSLLNIALPRQVAEHLMKYPERYDETVRAPATVIFCDIKGFTSAVERLGGNLDELKFHLERAMDAVVEEHIEEDLIVDKFIGDAIMSFRGGHLSSSSPAEHAARVVRAALRGIHALASQDNPHFKALKVGGASAEDALIGTFGTSKRLSYTILGDRVNLAARLEGTCNMLGVSNLFCDRTRALTVDCEDIVWRRVGKVLVHGKFEVIDVFQAFEPSADTAWIPDYHQAAAHYEAGELIQAQQCFEAVLAVQPNDGPSELYRDECVRHGADVPADWSPVLRTKK